jgi:hypothetical protein
MQERARGSFSAFLLGLEPVRSCPDIYNQRDVQLHGCRHDIRHERAKLNRFFRWTFENEFVVNL